MLPDELLLAIGRFCEPEVRSKLAEALGWPRKTFVRPLPPVPELEKCLRWRQSRQTWSDWNLAEGGFWHGRIDLIGACVFVDVFVPKGRTTKGGTIRIQKRASTVRAFLGTPEHWFEHSGDQIFYSDSNVTRKRRLNHV